MHTYPHGSRPKVRRAFTLIELLTVIAIIGILAAIIIPTVSAVRATAKKASCVSRLRQWGTVVNLCANDYKGTILVSFIKDTNKPNQPYVYDPYITSNKMMGEELKAGTALSALSPTQALTICPNGQNNDNVIGGSIRQYSFVVPIGVTAKTAQPFGLFDTTYFYKFSAAEAPAKLLLMIEQNNGGSLVNPGSIGGIKAALGGNAVRRVQLDPGYIRHNGTANALFLDGHVAGLSPTDTDYDNVDSRPNLERWFSLK